MDHSASSSVRFSRPQLLQHEPLPHPQAPPSIPRRRQSSERKWRGVHYIFVIFVAACTTNYIFLTRKHGQQQSAGDSYLEGGANIIRQDSVAENNNNNNNKMMMNSDQQQRALQMDNMNVTRHRKHKEFLELVKKPSPKATRNNATASAPAVNATTSSLKRESRHHAQSRLKYYDKDVSARLQNFTKSVSAKKGNQSAVTRHPLGGSSTKGEYPEQVQAQSQSAVQNKTAARIRATARLAQLLAKQRIPEKPPKYEYHPEVDWNTVLTQYAPSRIPGYLRVDKKDEIGPYGFNQNKDDEISVVALYGHVMRDLANRVLDHRLFVPYFGASDTSILVVSPVAPRVVSHLTKLASNYTNRSEATKLTVAMEESLRKRIAKYNVGGSFLVRAHREQGLLQELQEELSLPTRVAPLIKYYGLDWTTPLDEWWRNSNANSTSFQLAVLDHGPSNNRIIKNATGFLQKAKINYLVVGFGVYPHNNNNTANNNTVISHSKSRKVNYGRNAVAHLLGLNYHIQLLSISHTIRDDIMRPNVELTLKNYATFFQLLRQRSQEVGVPILGYIFCTQTKKKNNRMLDMAIPTALVYQPTLTVEEGVRYKRCPETHLSVEFLDTQPAAASLIFKPTPKTPLRISCWGTRIYNRTSSVAKSQHELRDIWYSGLSIESSETACVTAVCDGTENVACVSRILPDHRNQLGEEFVGPLPPADEDIFAEDFVGPQQTASETKSESTVTSASKPKNVLILKVSPISRARFKRSLVKTHALLQRLNFTSFDRFTAIGIPELDTMSDTMVVNTNDTLVVGDDILWEAFRKNGYATMNAQDQCVRERERKVVKATQHHGEQFHQMLCYDFRRPNCLGNMAASRHLIDYGSHFIQSYEQQNQPWAAILNFVDSREDSQTLEGTLDNPLWEFLYSLYQPRQSSCELTSTNSWSPALCSVWDSTVLVVMSEVGMHYGGYFLSQQGRKESAQPILYMHVPGAPASLQANSKKWTTLWDFFETILDFTVSEAEPTSHFEGTGSSLLRALPSDRNACSTTAGISSQICAVLEGNSTTKTMMPNPPSVLSFYADIPTAHKLMTPICNAKQSAKVFPANTSKVAGPAEQCVCATNMRPWYNCSSHPWEENSSNLTSQESFAMIECGPEAQSFEINVQRSPEILKRSKLLPTETSPSSQQRPNILLLEVDSVSTAYADRHFPRTRELLNRMRLRKNDTTTSGFTCDANEILCAAEFETFSVVGSNSIPNQIAAFGGCVVTTGPENCNILRVDEQNRTICNDKSHQVHKMELVNQHRSSATYCLVDAKKRSPWIFDIAKTAGYVTLFGEEFCYRGSKWVPQGNVFPLEVDILPSEFFCRVAERRAAKLFGTKMVGPAYQYGYEPRTGEPMCVDENGGYESGLVGLDHIESMWNTYPDVPKLAYLNAIAAHYYKDFKSMASRAEAYDILLSSFLQRMLARPDMTNTILVLRADHGLQGGLTTPDYSIQQEALRPWTELVIPKTLPGLSLETLFDNQQQLATGFDIYKTITESVLGTRQSLAPPMPRWALHLWKTAIPPTRTCADANVRGEYCLFESQRTFTAPNLGTCNLAEEEQSLVCPHLEDSFHNQMSAAVSAAFYTTDHIKPQACPGDTVYGASTAASPSLLEIWNIIDKDTGNSRSVGLDDAPLPMLQTAILTTLVRELEASKSLNICMDGFGSGLAAALFLDSSPTLRLHIFDKMERLDQKTILQTLKSRFGAGRLSLYDEEAPAEEVFSKFLSPMIDFVNEDNVGNNINKTDDAHVACDFVFGANNTLDMVRSAPCGILVVSGARTSLRDLQVYFGRTISQWSQLQKDGCLKDITCFEGDPASVPLRGTNKTMTITQKWCMGITTGICQTAFQKAGLHLEYNQKRLEDQCNSKMAQVTRQRIVLDHVCPSHTIQNLPSPMAPFQFPRKTNKN